ncbi:MAG: hypothetical protein RJA36_2920 [Pseudomonadota bacterium]|jgi:hypothetical protein
MKPAWPSCRRLLWLLLWVCGACLAADPQLELGRDMGAYDNAVASGSPVQLPAQSAASSQAVPAAPPIQTAAPPASAADRLTHEFRMREEDNKLYEIAILSALALLSLFIVLRFITGKPGARYTATDIVNATGLIFIIFGTILLVIMADTGEQLTAAIGILGAVAGYIFGAIKQKATAARDEAERTDKPDN